MAKKKEVKNTNWFQVIRENGEIGQFSKEPIEGSTQVKDSEGKIKNFTIYEGLEGKLIQVFTYDKELDSGKTFENLSITVENEEGKENLALPFCNAYASCFIQRLENVDLTKDVLIKSFKIKNKEKSEAKGKEVFNELLLIYQEKDGKMISIENLYKKDSGHKLPDFIKKEKKKAGKIEITWDTSDYEEALRQIVISTNEKLKGLNKEKELTASIEKTNVFVGTTEEESDDLPD